MPGLPFRGPALRRVGERALPGERRVPGRRPARVRGGPGRLALVAGTDRSGPAWSERERDAAALFRHPEIGELSVTRNAPLGLWLMLYNSGTPRGIVARTAVDPWGPWSAAVVVLDPARDGYGAFMHVKDAPDGLSDPGREHEWGGEYGPYVVDRYTRALPGGRAAVYFVLSTWNPYQVVEMGGAAGGRRNSMRCRVVSAGASSGRKCPQSSGSPVTSRPTRPDSQRVVPGGGRAVALQDQNGAPDRPPSPVLLVVDDVEGRGGAVLLADRRDGRRVP